MTSGHNNKAQSAPKQSKTSVVYNAWPIALLLIIVAAVVFQFAGWWWSLILVAVAAFLLLGRQLIQRQTAHDFVELAGAQATYRNITVYPNKKSDEYLDFIDARSQQLLKDVHILTPQSRQQLKDYVQFVSDQRKSS